MARDGQTGNDVMADQSDVENSLVSKVLTALYPHGTSEPSIPGPDCRIYRGWPNPTALDSDLASGKVNVTVFPGSGTGRTTTRYSDRWIGEPRKPTLTAMVSGSSVTFGGNAAAGQIAGVLFNGKSCAYRTQDDDTPELVAANLAAVARCDTIVNLSYSTLTIPGARGLLARVVSDAQVQCEVRRQEQNFRVTCWCPSPEIRDTTATAIDRLLGQCRFIDLSDGTSGRVMYVGTTVFDQSQNASLYRRDLDYSIEYPTILGSTLPAMLFGTIGLNATTATT